MDFSQEYAAKLISADAAAELVKDGDWVEFGYNISTPQAVDAALAKRLPSLHDVHIRGGVLPRIPEIFKIDDPGAHFDYNSVHMSGVCRKAQDKGFGYYIPIRYSELPRYYRENMKVDVAFMTVTPMDSHGDFHFGLSASHIRSVFDAAKLIVLEVNKNMPTCRGRDVTINISEVDHVVESGDPPLCELPSPEPSEADSAIAGLVLPMIPNGACLQLGIGGMPNAVGRLIADSDLKNLGVHTEMYVDSYVDMALAGRINGSRKSIDRGLQIYTFAAGSQRLYDYLDDNPQCCAVSVDYTNDCEVIAANDNVISINNAIDVDLYGQVNAESAGIRNISGAGGQLDFVLGAYKSKGGKSFICLTSTFKDKKTGELKSRIRPTMQNAGIVTDTRANIQYLCTEYGCVDLKGTSTWQRAEAIISVAHPSFREALIKEAEEMKIWRDSNKR